MQYQAPLGSADPNAPYVQGNPAAGLRGSYVPAPAIEQPMRELLAVIAADPRLVPSNTDLTQVLEAIRYLIATAIAAIPPVQIPAFPPIPTYGATEGVKEAANTFSLNYPGLAPNPDVAATDLLAFYETVAEGGEAAGVHRSITFSALAAAILALQTQAIAEASGEYVQFKAFPQPGSFTFVPDPLCTAIEIMCWAAGGGGGYCPPAAAGGGGGGFAWGSYPCTPGSPIAVVVGAGGGGGTSGAGGTGGSSSVGPYIGATGGTGGYSTTPGNGGAAGSDDGAQILLAGRPGLLPNIPGGGLYFPGGGGGTFGCGDITTSGPVYDGTAPGQGGTGGNNLAGGRPSGGNGANGLVIIKQLIG